MDKVYQNMVLRHRNYYATHSHIVASLLAEGPVKVHALGLASSSFKMGSTSSIYRAKQGFSTQGQLPPHLSIWVLSVQEHSFKVLKSDFQR